MARQINAKYSGKCAHCSGAISPGDPIMYEPEAKAVWHIECHADRMSTERSPVKPVQAGTTARWNVVAKDQAHRSRTSKEEMEYQIGKAEREHEEHLELCDKLEREQSEKLIACLKRVRGALSDSMELRTNLKPRDLYNDITATLKAVLGEGSWME